MTDILKICPPESELSEYKNEYPCPEANCMCVFTKASNLNMHLAKHHKIGSIKTSPSVTSALYYCPVESCNYNIKSHKKKSFSMRRLLKQHYMKVHAVKQLSCEKCNTKFSIASTFKRHQLSCGARYVCGVCNWEYSSNESLMVHLMRKHPDVHRAYLENKNSAGKASCPATSSNNLTIVTLQAMPHNSELPVENIQVSTDSCYTVNDTLKSKNLYSRTTSNLKYDNRFTSEEKLIPTKGKFIANTNDISSLYTLVQDTTEISQFLNKTSSTNNLIAYDLLDSSEDKNEKMHEGLTVNNELNNSNSTIGAYALVPVKLLPHLNLDNKCTKSIAIQTDNTKVKYNKNSRNVHERSLKNCKKTILRMSANSDVISSNQAHRFTQTSIKTAKKCTAENIVKSTVQTQTQIAAQDLLSKSIEMTTCIDNITFRRSLSTQTATKDPCKVLCKHNTETGNSAICKCNKNNCNIKNSSGRVKHLKYEKRTKSYPNKSHDSKSEKHPVGTHINFSHRTSENVNKNVASILYSPLDKCSKILEIDKDTDCIPQINHLSSTSSVPFDNKEKCNTIGLQSECFPESYFDCEDPLRSKHSNNSANIQTQTALDELLYSNIRPNCSEDSLLFSELVCLSDIQTQTWPLNCDSLNNDIDMSVMNSLDCCLVSEKKYNDSDNFLISTETQTMKSIFDFTGRLDYEENGSNYSPDCNFKETQTCFCYSDYPKYCSGNNAFSFDGLSSNLGPSCSFPSIETQTSDCCLNTGLLSSQSDVLLSCSSTETQTCFEDILAENAIEERETSSNGL